ncbi:MAG: hypothetical protein AB1560_00765 [Pseudomonadota bacterium]
MALTSYLFQTICFYLLFLASDSD